MKLNLQLDRAPRSIFTNPIHFIACGFGIGIMPIIPGTFGTLMSLPFCLVFSRYSVLMYVLLTLICLAISAWATDVTCRDFGVHDHTATVSDEVSGFLVTMISIPIHWWTLLLAFILFRFFDILKPGPIAWIDQHIHGGLGVVLDDVVAAAFTWIIMLLITYLF